MLYFSQLQGKKVVVGNRKPIGKLKDFIFLATESPLITTIIVKSARGKSIRIPIDEVEEISGNVTVNAEYKTIERAPHENELSLLKNLLDKQIIDVKGGKVVRVNDVAIQQKEDSASYYIAGVDIGFRAILRWIKLEEAALPIYRLFRVYSHPHFLSWADIEPLELARGNIQLKKEAGELEKMRPEDLADYLEKTNIKNVNEIVNNLEEKFAADVIADLNVSYQSSLFRRFSSEKGAKLIEYLDPDESVDILLAITKEKRHEIMELLPKKKRNELHELIKYSKTPIGELINPEFITISSEDTVASALEKVKDTVTESHFSAYIYVVNIEGELNGVVDLIELLKNVSDTQIHTIMKQDVVVAHLTTPKEIATKKMLKYRLYAIPVIESNKKIIGIVMYDDLVEDILEKL